jgi:lipopolysaccharide transport system permease protein
MNKSVNVHRSGGYPSGLIDIFRPLTRHSHLLGQLSKRGIQSRYRGSVLGMFWSLLTPLLMLLVYSFVFSVVFKAKWNHPGAEDANFGVILFSGMIIHALFSEPMVLSSVSITGNTQYVKKVVFPLEVMTWSTTIVAAFQALISFFILIFFMLVTGMTIHPTLLLFPIVVAPLLLLSVGIGWLLSSLTVYIRDIAQLVGIVSTVALFISPVFYPVDRLPLPWQSIIYLNPISYIVDQMRRISIYGELPDWTGLGVYTLVSLLVAWMGLAIFQRLRTGFADVL